jgi:hypothetical protein
MKLPVWVIGNVMEGSGVHVIWQCQNLAFPYTIGVRFAPPGYD